MILLLQIRRYSFVSIQSLIFVAHMLVFCFVCFIDVHSKVHLANTPALFILRSFMFVLTLHLNTLIDIADV